MRPRTSNEKVLLGVLVAILFLGANWIGYGWYADQLKTLRAKASSLQTDQDSAQSALSEIPMWQKNMAWLKEKQPPLGDEGTAKAALLDFVVKGAKENKLEVQDQNFVDVKKTSAGTQVTVYVKVKGGMQDLVKWLAPLQKPDDFYAITLFSLKADADQKSYDCTLNIARYYKGGSSS
jgi:hypothetical protein